MPCGFFCGGLSHIFHLAPRKEQPIIAIEKPPFRCASLHGWIYIVLKVADRFFLISNGGIYYIAHGNNTNQIIIIKNW